MRGELEPHRGWDCFRIETTTVRVPDVRTSSSINTACCHLPEIKTPPLTGGEEGRADDDSPNVRPPIAFTTCGVMGSALVVRCYQPQGAAQTLEYPTFVLIHRQGGCRPLY